MSPVSSLDRFLIILNTFDNGTPILTADEICARNGFAMATGYRYIRQLCESGLLVRLPRGYALGPRIIEWDYMMRRWDPLLTQSREIVMHLAVNTGLEVLLSQLYGDRIVNVHYEHQSSNELLHFGRGRIMPLFRGSTSRVILAHMPSRELRRLFEEHAAELDVQRLGKDWAAFSQSMLQVRRSGFAISVGEVLDTGKIGIAAPIFGEQGAILASLTLVGAAEDLNVARQDDIAQRVMEGARSITKSLSV